MFHLEEIFGGRGQSQNHGQVSYKRIMFRCKGFTSEREQSLPTCSDMGTFTLRCVNVVEIRLVLTG